MCVALSADPGTQPREQGQMWSPVGCDQGVPTFKEAACCSEQPGRGAARDTVGPYECTSDKPEGASPRLIGAQVWRCLPRTCRWSPTCPTAGPDMVCVCRMAAPMQEENRSSVVTEGPSGMGDGGGSHQRVLREVSQKGWPHGDTDHSEMEWGSQVQPQVSVLSPPYLCSWG